MQSQYTHRKSHYIKNYLFLNGHTVMFAVLILITGCGKNDQLPEQKYPVQPNILWISVEDIGPYLGAYGDPVAETPVVDQLAKEGMLFKNAFTTAGVCAPSRAAIITGMHQSSFGAHHMRTVFQGLEDLPTPYLTVPPPYVKTFTEYLRAEGYYTTNNFKTDYQFAPQSDTRQPLTAWDESDRDAHWSNAPDGQPFFSVINLMTTHESRLRPNPNRPVTVDPALVEVPPYYPDTPVIREQLALQYSNIARQDEQIGEILAELEEAGLADNTVVFFWSDHGGALPRQKRWIYDSGIHVPLIIRWPGVIEPGEVNNEMVSFIDLGPTVLSMAGVDIPGHMHGRALLGPQKGEPVKYIYAARDRLDSVYDMVRAVRDHRFKYIRNYYPNDPYVRWISYRNALPSMQQLLRYQADDKLEGPQKLWFQNTRPVHELYDISEDPHEINNLAYDPEYREVFNGMQKELDRWMTEIGDMGHISEDELADKFWPGGEQPVTTKPYFIVNAPGYRSTEARREGGRFSTPYTVELLSATHGASIAYTFEEGDDPHWKLYTGPIHVMDTMDIRTRAIRYGYLESEEVSATFTVLNEN